MKKKSRNRLKKSKILEISNIDEILQRLDDLESSRWQELRARVCTQEQKVLKHPLKVKRRVLKRERA